MKYTIRLEFDVESVDLADIVVEADSAQEALQKAIQSYEDGTVELDYYSSKHYDSTLRVDDSDSWLIDEIEDTDG